MAYFSDSDIAKFEGMPLNFLETSLSNFIFRITLNRPEKRNAFTPTMVNELAYVLQFASSNDSVRCVIINAEGPVFCAGADLLAFKDASVDNPNDNLPKPEGEITLGDAFKNLHKPSIAEVSGPVLAGGFLIIAGCTIVISTSDAYYSLPEAKRGLWPMQVMASLLKIIPPRRVLEMCITGRNYSAEEALQAGLVSELVAKDKLRETVNNLAAIIAKNAPLAIKKGFQAFDKLEGIPADAQHSYLKQQLELLLQSEDAQEGINAFKGKRPPVWRNK